MKPNACPRYRCYQSKFKRIRILSFVEKKLCYGIHITLEKCCLLLKTSYQRRRKNFYNLTPNFLKNIFLESIEKISQITSSHHLQIPNGLVAIGVRK